MKTQLLSGYVRFGAVIAAGTGRFIGWLRVA
jgi:hypothetical protein